MVYVYAKKSKLCEYIGKELSVDDIKETLVNLGMDIKGEQEGTDPELKIEITAEKIDMVSAVGIARAIKYYRGYEKEVPRFEVIRGTNKVIVKKSANESRPKTVCAILRDINMSENMLTEIIEIQEKIHASFGRNRKKVAIGIYPLEDFEFPVLYYSEEPKKINFRPLEADNEMNAIEILEEHSKGKMFSHLLNSYTKYPIFVDNNKKIMSMPPVINSHDTGRVQDHHKDLFIECSGYNLKYLDSVLKVLVTSFADMGCKIETVKVEYEDYENYELDLTNYFEEIPISEIRRLIGVDLDNNQIKESLNKMMYGVKEINESSVIIEIPSFRADVWHDIDIIDDIARGYGYNNIAPSFPQIASVGETLKSSRLREQLSNSLVNLGFIELYTYMLTSTEFQFDKLGLDKSGFQFVKLLDSEEEGYNMVRTMLYPEVLRSLNFNRKNKYPHKVFENGYAIIEDKNLDTLASNNSRVCVAIADPRANYTWIKGVFDSFNLINELNLEVRSRDNFPYLIQGRSAEIIYNKEVVGFIGETHPKVLTNFGIIVPVVVFEIDLDKILYD